MGFPSQVNAFGRDLYTVASSETTGNLFLSGLSVAAALGMVQAGATGETATEMAAVMHGADAATALSSWEKLLERFDQTAADKTVGAPKVRVANGVWVQAASSLNPKFVVAVQKSFHGVFKAADFVSRGEATRAEINGFVEERTNKRITDLLPSGSVGADTRAILVNALHFDAKWATPFKAHLTRKDRDFHVSAEKTVKCAMMTQKEHHPYVDGGAFDYVQLQYVGGSMAMELIVPKDIAGLAAVEATLAGDTFHELRRKAVKTEVSLALPKFTVEGGGSIAKHLKSLGLSRAFSPSAEFTGMFESEADRVLLSDCFHKTYIRVDEEGTEAAAATAARMTLASMPAKPAVPVTVDRPSLVALTDLKTGVHLFIGKLVDPSA